MCTMIAARGCCSGSWRGSTSRPAAPWAAASRLASERAAVGAHQSAAADTIWLRRSHTPGPAFLHSLRRPCYSPRPLCAPPATPGEPSQTSTVWVRIREEDETQLLITNLQHLANVASSKHLVHAGELVGLLRREIRREDAVVRAPPAEELAGGARRGGVLFPASFHLTLVTWSFFFSLFLLSKSRNRKLTVCFCD